MVDTLRSMVQIKVFKKRFNVPKSKISSIPNTQRKKQTPYELVAIGASVGGPQALHFILSKLPSNFPIPIVIVQHMTPGFINGFAQWLEDNIEITVKIAEDAELLKSGIVYFAPDGKHLTVTEDKRKVCLTDTAPVSGFKPAATVLFESVAKSCGSLAIGALLTGMGSDGAKGLLQIKNSQGKTFIQDESSAIVFGMGGVAQSLGAVDEVVNLDKIPDYLIDLTKQS
jgi:two-component system chemotaxis response regulator CheB